MKILLMGDASNYHRTLAIGLRRLGHEVTVASDGTGWMQTQRDIDLGRVTSGKLGGLELWWRVWHRLHSRFKGYDVVQIHSTNFLNLKPQRIRRVFDRLKRENGSIFLTCLGTDTPYVEQSVECPPQVRYNEMYIAGTPAPYALKHPEIIKAWRADKLKSHCRHIYNEVDGAVSALYEYHMSALRWMAPERVAYAGIPIDMSELRQVEIPESPGKVRFLLGRHATRMAEKGTDLLEAAVRRALDLHPGKGELVIVENRPYSEYLELLSSAHVLIDQAYSYTPATNALLAMGMGIPAVSGGEPEYYDFIGEYENRPVLNSPTDLEGMTALFEHILLRPGELRERGKRSREFVEKHNSCHIVAHRFTDFWASRTAHTPN